MTSKSPKGGELRNRKEKKAVDSISHDAHKVAHAVAEAVTPSKWKKMITRVLVGATMIGAFTLILLSDHTIVALFVLGLQVLVFKEILSVRYKAAKEKKIPQFRTLNWFFLVATSFFLYGKQVLIHLPNHQHGLISTLLRSHLAISFVLYVIAFTTFIVTLKKGLYKYQLGQFAWTLMTLLVVVFQCNFIIINIYEALIWFVLPCCIIVCNDIFAYFCGFFLGHKFVQRPLMSLSPNKTWEGFIGATFCTILFAFIFSDFLSDHLWFVCPRPDLDRMFEPLHCMPNAVFISREYALPESITAFLYNYLRVALTSITLRPIQIHSIVLALFGSLIAPFGGFYASAVKRAYNVKDFGNIFPGHGGFTDRTDCQYIMGLFVYVYIHVFIRTASMNLSTILEQIPNLSLEEQIIMLKSLNETVLQGLAQNASLPYY